MAALDIETAEPFGMGPERDGSAGMHRQIRRRTDPEQLAVDLRGQLQVRPKRLDHLDLT